MAQTQTTPTAPTLKPLSEGLMRVSILTALPALLHKLGHAPEPMLAELGIEPGLLDDAENLLPFHQVGSLLHHCVQRTGCQHLGVLLGQYGGMATLGLVGELSRHSPDVGSALRTAIKYLHHHDQGGMPVLMTQGKLAVFAYEIYARNIPAAEQILAAALTIMLQIMRELCGAHWRPAGVIFPFCAPHDVEAYARVFQLRPQFDAERAALIFPLSCLRQPLQGADPEVRQTLVRCLQEVEVKCAPSAPRLVHGMLSRGEATLAALAQARALSKRTLSRRLHEQGASFRQLKQDARMDKACQLLRDTENTIADIASSLGYAGASPFTRAFRRWAGVTPSAWRLKHKNLP